MKGTIVVVNVETYCVGDFKSVHYVGRACGRWSGSALGNPFKIGREGDRDQVILKYRYWLFAEINKEQGEAFEELMKLLKLHISGRTVILGCWCSPNKCHAEVIRKAIKWMASQDKYVRQLRVLRKEVIA